MKPVEYSVRPPLCHPRVGGGPSVEVDSGVGVVSNHPGGVAVARAVFPVGQTIEKVDDDTL